MSSTVFRNLFSNKFSKHLCIKSRFLHTSGSNNSRNSNILTKSLSSSRSRSNFLIDLIRWVTRKLKNNSNTKFYEYWIETIFLFSLNNNIYLKVQSAFIRVSTFPEICRMISPLYYILENYSINFLFCFI